MLIVFNLFVRNHRTRNRDTIYYNIIISADIPQKAPDRKVSQLNEKFRQYIISHRPVTGKTQFDTFRSRYTDKNIVLLCFLKCNRRFSNGNDVLYIDERRKIIIILQNNKYIITFLGEIHFVQLLPDVEMFNANDVYQCNNIIQNSTQTFAKCNFVNIFHLFWCYIMYSERSTHLYLNCVKSNLKN